MRGRRSPISIHTATADNLDYSAATVLFLFNPFGAATLAPLLEKIGREASRDVRIAYPQPTHHDVFEQQAWLEQTAHSGRDREGSRRLVLSEHEVRARPTSVRPHGPDGSRTRRARRTCHHLLP